MTFDRTLSQISEQQHRPTSELNCCVGVVFYNETVSLTQLSVLITLFFTFDIIYCLQKD